MPGVLAVLTGAGRAGRRAQAASRTSPPPCSAARHRAAQPRRLAGARLRAAARCCRPTASATSAQRSRSWSPRRSPQAKDAAERVVVDYEPLPAVIDAPARRRSRRAAALRRHRQRLHRCRGRRRRGDRGGVRARRACRAARDLGPARHRRADGAARRGRRLRSGDRALHAATPARGGVVRPEERARGDPRRAAEPRARRRARRRRQFRHPQLLLSRIRAGGLGGASARPAGEMDLRAPRGVRSATTRAAISR